MKSHVAMIAVGLTALLILAYLYSQSNPSCGMDERMGLYGSGTVPNSGSNWNVQRLGPKIKYQTEKWANPRRYEMGASVSSDNYATMIPSQQKERFSDDFSYPQPAGLSQTASATSPYIGSL